MGSSASTVLSPVPSASGSPPLPSRLVIYDGVCNLCDHTVKFLIARDPGKAFKFCALQSEAAKPILATFGLDKEEALKSIVFVDGGVAYRKSEAAMRIASYLPFPWNALFLGRLVPGPLRDGVYDCVASNRYRLFGKHGDGNGGEDEVCLRPSPDVLSRFLDADEVKGAPKKKKQQAGEVGEAAKGQLRSKEDGAIDGEGGLRKR